MRKSFVLVAFCVALMLGLAPTRVWGEEKEKEEAGEVKVKFDQIPAAVQKTLTAEAGGAKIEEVDKETDDGKTIYEADVKINDKNYEIKVAEDGKLISKKLDEGDEKGEGKEVKDGKKEDKDEKDEKK